MVGEFYSIVAPNITGKNIGLTGLIGSTYHIFGFSQNKHVYGDACLGAVKCRSDLDDAVARSERDITEGDKVYFGGNVGTITKLGYNKGEKILFRFLTFLV